MLRKEHGAENCGPQSASRDCGARRGGGRRAIFWRRSVAGWPRGSGPLIYNRATAPLRVDLDQSSFASVLSTWIGAGRCWVEGPISLASPQLTEIYPVSLGSARHTS
jgi:hypothetical protein